MSHAASVTLTGVTGNRCTYNAMSVQPDGSFSVSCTGSSVPNNPPPSCQQTNTCTSGGAFSFTQTTGTAPANAAVALFIQRTGGTGAVNVPLTFSGSCTYNGGSGTTTTFADGQGLLGFYANTTSDGLCTIGFGTPSMVSGTVDNPPTASGQVVVTVGNGPNTAAPPPPGQCPTGFTAPQDLSVQSLGGLGNPLLSMAKSGQIVTMTLPATQPGYSSGQVAFSESAGGAYTPQPVTLTISINKCPGLIETDTNNRCNIVSTNGNYNSISWFSKAYSVIDTSFKANQRGYCWAPASEGPWYVNAKWSYSSCAFGAQICGFAVQQNYGPY